MGLRRWKAFAAAMKLERHEWVEVLRHLDTALDLP